MTFCLPKNAIPLCSGYLFVPTNEDNIPRDADIVVAIDPSMKPDFLPFNKQNAFTNASPISNANRYQVQSNFEYPFGDNVQLSQPPASFNPVPPSCGQQLLHSRSLTQNLIQYGQQSSHPSSLRMYSPYIQQALSSANAVGPLPPYTGVEQQPVISIPSTQHSLQDFPPTRSFSYPPSLHSHGQSHAIKNRHIHTVPHMSSGISEQPTALNCKTHVCDEYWTKERDDEYWKQRGFPSISKHLLQRIARQIETYFSDNYLRKNIYLLQQIQNKKSGYISLKLVTSYKRIKQMKVSSDVVRRAIVLNSDNLAISKNGKSIKREDLPEDLKKRRESTQVVAIRLPLYYNSVEKVSKLFSNFGEIILSRLLKPNAIVPHDLRNYATQISDFGQSLCCVVEFQTSKEARDCVRVLNYAQCPAIDENVLQFQKRELAKYLQDFEYRTLQRVRFALLGQGVRRLLYQQDKELFCKK